MAPNAVTGLLGGAFDPPHNGHLALARAALDHFGLERLVVAPGGQPPLKGETVETDAETRLRLVETAFAGLPRTEVSRIDIDRPQPAYSDETVRRASERWGEIVFVVGADRFADFLRWKAPNEILRHARLGVATRPGVSRDECEHVLAGLEQPHRVAFFEIPAVDVSSREIRRLVAAGEHVDDLVPPPVARLISELGLYRS
jgi:nicotinate-nucleotide adenylyltransferase